MRLLALLLSTLFIFSSAASHAEPRIRYAHRLFTTRDGLPKIEVTCLYEDTTGYLWIGTKGGLARFDGLNFKTFTTRTGLLGSINAITKLADGRMLILTGRGIQFIDGDIVSRVYTDSIYNFYFNSGMLIGNTYYIRTSFSKKVDYLASHGASPILAFDILRRRFRQIGLVQGCKEELTPATTDKALIFSTDSLGNKFYYQVLSPAGLSRKFLLPFKLAFAARKLSHENTLLLDQGGNLHTVKFLAATVDFPIIGPRILTDNFKFLYRGRRNILFYISKDGQLYRFEGGRAERIAPVNIAHAAIEDRQGNFWLASEDGLYCFYNFRFKEYNWEFNKDKPDLIWSMAELSDNCFLLNSYTEGLWKYNERSSTITPFSFSGYNSTNPKNLTLMYHPVKVHDTVFYPGSGDYLIATPRAAFCKNDSLMASLYFYYDSFTHHVLSGGPAIRYIDERMDMKTLFDGDQLGLKGMFVLSMCRDRYQRLWYTASGVVGCIDTNGLIHKFNLPGYGTFFSVLRDHTGNLWFAGYDGLWHYNYSCLQHIANPKLHSIGALYEYKNRYLLISSVNRLAILRLDSFYSGHCVINTYAHNNGYHGLDFSQNSILEDHRGDIWVNTKNNVIRFNPDSLLPNVIPQPYINFVLFTADNVHWKQLRDTAISSPGNNIRISFAAVTLSHAGDVYYRYCLDGFSSWSLPLISTEQTFTNLPVGNYRFRVQASLDALHWSSTATYTFTVRPRWYQTFLFYCTIVACLVLFAVLITYIIQHSKRKKDIQKRKLVSLQLQSIRNRMLPHLTNNVYTNIIRLIKKNEPALAVDYTIILSRLNNKILSLSEQKSQSLSDELAFVEEYLKLQQLIYKDRLRYIIQLSPEVDKEIRVPILVLHTFTENAIKHGIMHRDHGGFITISATKSGASTLLSVKDDGVGQQYAATLAKNSSGQGLYILRELVKIFNSNNSERIEILLEDCIATNGQVLGAIATISIPDKYNF